MSKKKAMSLVMGDIVQDRLNTKVQIIGKPYNINGLIGCYVSLLDDRWPKSRGSLFTTSLAGRISLFKPKP